LLLLSSTVAAQAIYKYRDADGHWVYTDRKPGDGSSELIELKQSAVSPKIFVERIARGDRSVLRAVNECLCTVEFGVHVTEPKNVDVPDLGILRATLAARSQVELMEIAPTGVGAPSYGYDWMYVLGAPGTRHAPDQPYRVPFAIGQTVLVSQAYPSNITHIDRSSEYAVDLVVPEGTPVYAARGGVVIDRAHDHYQGGITPSALDQANFIQILHDDGTVAIYAHLQWDSIRVQPGQQIRRGDYIANAGSTGFSSGPHLHFAVLRNAGLQTQSVPLQFSGANGVAVEPRTGMRLTVY
jgi:murein DD-endopeptidase MepM/ murein hydrolase activator NlpD